MNILLTCAGRRNYLIQYFREALGGHGRICAADANPDAAALVEADLGFVVPPVDHLDYLSVIKDICMKQQIRLLIPLNDLELPYLARMRDEFLKIGTISVVSSPDIIETCFDKCKSIEFLKQHGLVTPYTHSSLSDAKAALERGKMAFPLIVKPRWGTSSIAINCVQDEEELEMSYHLVKKQIKRTILADASMVDFEHSVLIQEFVDSEEYGLDIINDLDGNFVTTFVKHKLTMRAGETDRAITVDNNKLFELGKLIGTALGHIGNLDCDVFAKKDEHYVLELNPRFGGGYPFSHVAGANIPAALIAWANSDELDPNWLKAKPNMMASKCDRLVTRRDELE